MKMKKEKLKFLNPILKSFQTNIVDLINPVDNKQKLKSRKRGIKKNKVSEIEKELGIENLNFNENNKQRETNIQDNQESTEEYLKLRNLLGQTAKKDLLNEIQSVLKVDKTAKNPNSHITSRDNSSEIKKIEEELGIRNFIEEKTEKIREEIKQKANVYNDELHNIEINTRKLIESKIKNTREEAKNEFQLFKEEIGIPNILDINLFKNSSFRNNAEDIQEDFRKFEEELGIRNFIEEKTEKIHDELNNDFRIFEEKIIDVENHTKKSISDKIKSGRDEIYNDVKDFEKELLSLNHAIKSKINKHKEESRIKNLTNNQQETNEISNKNEIAVFSSEIKNTIKNQLNNIKRELNYVNIESNIKRDLYLLEHELHNLSSNIKANIKEKIQRVKDDIVLGIDKMEEEINAIKNTIKSTMATKCNKVRNFVHNVHLQDRIKKEFINFEERINKSLNEMAAKTNLVLEKPKNFARASEKTLKEEIKTKVREFEGEIIKVGENIKEALKKKEKLSEKDQLKIIAYKKISLIKLNNIKKAFEDFSWYFKVFIQRYFSIKYEFTSVELKNELSKKEISSVNKKNILNLFKFIEDVKYVGKKLTQKELKASIQKALTTIKSLK